MIPLVAGLLAAAMLATSPSGGASASDPCVSSRPGVNRSPCQDVAPDRQGLAAVTPTARSLSPIALRARNLPQRSSASAHAELLLALAPSRDDPSSAIPSEAGAEDNPQRNQSEAANRSILMAALAFAGIAGSVIFKLSGVRFRRRTRLRKRRGAIWAAADRARRISGSIAGIDDRSFQPNLVRDLDQVAQRKASRRKAAPRQARRSPV